ncbi:MAG: hypothetical protein ACYTFM_00590 [Planctomycetota bacterium]|jgi:hypothetical protein
MMRRNLVIVAYSIVLLSFVICLIGCSQQGETTAEGSRRHHRVMAIGQQQLVEDVDKALLLDEPSRLTEKRVR